MSKLLTVAEIESLLRAGYYLTTKQAAAYLHIKTKSLADYRSKCKKPEYIKRGNDVRYSAAAIIEFIIERNKVKRMAEYDELLSTTLLHDTSIMNEKLN